MWSSDSPRIGFLGTGQMATALAKGWLAAGLARAERILGSDPLPQARDKFQAATGARAIADNREVVAGSDVIMLAVKPQTMEKLFAEVRPIVAQRHLIVSIAAGITLRQITDGLGPNRRIIRV